jgi:hypothetical protein
MFELLAPTLGTSLGARAPALARGAFRCGTTTGALESGRGIASGWCSFGSRHGGRRTFGAWRFEAALRGGAHPITGHRPLYALGTLGLALCS